MKNFIVFMIIWCIGCAFVDYIIPNVANSYQMMVGVFTFVIGYIFTWGEK